VGEMFYSEQYLVDNLKESFNPDDVEQLLIDFVESAKKYYEYTEEYDAIMNKLKGDIDESGERELKEEYNESLKDIANNTLEEMGLDYRVDEDEVKRIDDDIWIFDPYNETGINLGRDEGAGWICLFEDYFVKEKELKKEDLNEGCWLVAEAREGSDTLKELYELLGKDINDIYPLLETSEDFEKAINYLKQWEYGDEEKEYEPYNDVIKYFSNYDEIDGYIIGETPKGDVLLYAKGEWTVDEKKNLKEEDMNEGCYFVAEAKDGSDLMNELYNLLGKEDYENLFSSKEDYEKALNYLKQREYGDEEKNYEPYYDVLKYFKGNYEEIDGYIIGETPYGDVLVYAKGEWTID